MRHPLVLPSRALLASALLALSLSATCRASAQAGASAPAAASAPASALQSAPPAAAQQPTAIDTPSLNGPGPDPRKPPPARPGALTLRQVVDLARQKNPVLLAAEQNLRAVRAQEIQAGVRANPFLGVAANSVTLPANTVASGAPNAYAYAVQVSRLFERGNKREYRLEDARSTTAQTQAQLDDTVRQTVLQVKTAFTRMLIAKVALELARANLKDFTREVQIANDRFQAGDLGKLDFERIDLQLGNFEADQANAEISLQQASDQIQTLLGVETPSPDFDITGDIIPPVLIQTQAELTRQALAHRPDYAAARAAVAVADAAFKLANANGTTDPTLEGEYDRSGTFNSAGFNINVPLRLFDRNQGNKESARLTIATNRLSETAARNQVISDVDQAWVAYARARALSDRFGQHYLDESADVLSTSRFSYEHGGLALIDYLDALREARSTTADALNAYATTWQAIHQLSASTTIELAP